MSNPIKILILGSEGFIGKHLLNFFTAQNYEVHCADVLSLQRAHYTQLVNGMSDIQGLFEKQHFDFCINAAGSAHVQFSYTHHYNDFSLNSILVFQILTAIRDYNPKCKFINFSSAAVYGNPESLPIAESQVTLPLSPYGWHKLYSESYCREFYTFFNISSTSLRVFSAYGPGLRKQLFWDLHHKIMKDDRLVMFGTGHETRDFIYIDDIMEAVQCVMNHGAFKGEAINIASGIETSIAEVAQGYIQICGKNTQATFSGETKIGDPLNWRANIDQLQSMGFKPKTTMEEGMRKYYQWMIEGSKHVS